MHTLKMFCLLLVASLLVTTPATALTDTQAATRWNELQATGINTGQVFGNLFAAGDLTYTDMVQVASMAPDRLLALQRLFETARNRRRLQPVVNAAVFAVLSGEVGYSMAEVNSAAEAAGADAAQLFVIAAKKLGWVQGEPTARTARQLQVVEPSPTTVSPSN